MLAIGLERMLRGRARFGESGGQGAGVEPVALRGWRRGAATLVPRGVVTAAFARPQRGS